MSNNVILSAIDNSRDSWITAINMQCNIYFTEFSHKDKICTTVDPLKSTFFLLLLMSLATSSSDICHILEPVFLGVLIIYGVKLERGQSENGGM